ncbi:MAG: LTA synthase family protein [Tumebacillaceae bacterium]
MKFLRIPFVLYTVFMIIKALHVRDSMYESNSFWSLIAGELSAFLILFGLVELTCRRRKNVIYFLLSFLLSTIYLAVLLFYRKFHQIPTFESVYLLGEATGVSDSILVLFEPSDVLMYLDLAVVSVLTLFRRSPFTSLALLQRKHWAGVLAASVLLSGSNLYSYANAKVLDTSDLARDVGLLNAEVYQAVQTQMQKSITTAPVTQQSIDDLKGTVKAPQPQYFGAAQGKNLIVIQMESFQNFLINLKVGGQEVTPNLNRLLGDSLYFDHFNSMIGQGNTNDAEIITNTSLYPLEHGALSSFYKNKELPSLPKLLRDRGYDTFTMHANEASFYSRDRVYPSLGYNQYYDKSYFGSEDVIGLGASDNVLYSKSLPLLLQRKDSGQPFYANYVSLSSHHPFTLPDGADDLVVPEQYQGTLLGDYLHAIHYTDAALGTFFAQLKANGLWDNTVIALYGDHFAFHYESAEAADQQLMSELLGHKYDALDMLNIPLIVRVPGMGSQVIHQVGGQIDTLPTLSNLLGIPLDGQIHFGQDLLNESHNLLGELFYLPTGSFLQDDALYLSESNTSLDMQSHKSSQGTDVQAATLDKVMQLESMSRSYLQDLPDRND